MRESPYVRYGGAEENASSRVCSVVRRALRRKWVDWGLLRGRAEERVRVGERKIDPRWAAERSCRGLPLLRVLLPVPPRRPLWRPAVRADWPRLSPSPRLGYVGRNQSPPTAVLSRLVTSLMTGGRGVGERECVCRAIPRSARIASDLTGSCREWTTCHDRVPIFCFGKFHF